MTIQEFIQWMQDATDKMENLDYRPGMKICQSIMRQKQNSNFAQSQTADGQKWKPRKDKEPHPLLILTGKMKNALIVGDGGYEDNSHTHLTWGIDSGEVPYAAIQQFGNEKVPARPFVEINDETADLAAEDLAKWFVKEVFGDL